MENSTPVNIFWFRRDLRLEDNAGLYHALKQGEPVLPLFIFDTEILNALPDRRDARVAFIHQALEQMHLQLAQMGSGLYVFHGTPAEAFRQITANYKVSAVYTNHDYEPYARRRDAEIGTMLAEQGAAMHTYKDQVVFEKDEVLKDNGEPYTVFTPYSKKWKHLVNGFYLKPYPCDTYFGSFLKFAAPPFPSLQSLGFEKGLFLFPPPKMDASVAKQYSEKRDIPGIPGTTRLSAHLRFGTVSVRKMVAQAAIQNTTLLNEFIWREFYQMILWHFPQVVNRAFKKEYDAVPYRNNEEDFERWRSGTTGYPIVDAGMRQLNATGYMHNRVRMVAASFLVKHLLTDWRFGEAYFASKLLDFDLAANNGGWQWCAGCGCDAAPYFRIFNPYLQTAKFDPDYLYIKQWIPDYDDLTYIRPMVDHNFARQRCLDAYKSVLGAGLKA